MNFEIVEINGKKYAEFENNEEAKKLTKKLYLSVGGWRYSHNGKIVYRAIGAYGNLQNFYKKVIENYG